MRNPGDSYVRPLARLDREGLKPSPEAARATLLRRLWLDLVGLPPRSRRWTRSWPTRRREPTADRPAPRLAALRRAPGEPLARPRALRRHPRIQKDPRRTMWRWRELGDQRFERNLHPSPSRRTMPRTCSPGATPPQIIATGFHRNTMISTTRAASTKREARYETLVDRVNTTASVFLGTTWVRAVPHAQVQTVTRSRVYRLPTHFRRRRRAHDPGADARDRRGARGSGKRKSLLSRRRSRSRPTLDALQSAWERERAARLVAWRPLVPSGVLSSGSAQGNRPARRLGPPRRREPARRHG